MGSLKFMMASRPDNWPLTVWGLQRALIFGNFCIPTASRRSGATLISAPWEAEGGDLRYGPPGFWALFLGVLILRSLLFGGLQ